MASHLAGRRATFVGVLTAGFVQEDGFKVCRDSLLAYANLGCRITYKNSETYNPKEYLPGGIRMAQ